MAGESKRGKLVSAVPMLRNGVQDTYQNKRDGSTMYKQTLTWDNGDVGEASTKTPGGNYKFGIELTYMKGSREYQGTTYYSFWSIKDPNYQSNSGGGAGRSSGGYKKSPEQQKIIINQVAMIGSNMIMNKLQEEYKVIYDQFRNWLYNKVFVLKEEPITTQGVFKIACEYFREQPIQSTTIKDVLDRAHTLLHHAKITTWTDPNQVPPHQSSPQSQPQVQEEEAQQPPPVQAESQSQEQPDTSGQPFVQM